MRSADDFVAVIFDHRVAEQIAADLVELGAKIGAVRSREVEFDKFTDPGALQALEAKAIEGMADSGALRIEHVFLGSDEDVNFHGR